jgi:DNA repair protein RadC
MRSSRFRRPGSTTRPIRNSRKVPPPTWPPNPLPDQPHYHGHRQRLRQKFLQAGPEALADYEILELLLFQAQSRGDMKPLAKELLRRFQSLPGVVSATTAELESVAGIGQASIVALKIVQAAALRMAKRELLDRPIFSSWDKVLDYCHASMAREKIEQFRLLFLDSRNALIADEVQQTGTVNHTPVYPREVVRRALELRASAVIMVHNHPSGDPTPSKDDIAMTREVKEAADKLGIVLHDHIIVGRRGHASFKALGLI